MARRKTTVSIDEELLRAVRALAARTGRTASDVLEAALRRFLGIDALRQSWERSSLSEDEAMDLAYSEIHEGRGK